MVTTAKTASYGCFRYSRRRRMEPLVQRHHHPPSRRDGYGRGSLAGAPQAAQIPLQIGRERRFDLDPGPRERVRERETLGVQELPLEAPVGDAVRPVADDGQVDRGQVDADLVRPAGLQPHVQQRVAVDQLGDLEVRHSLTRRVGVERAARRVGAVAADDGLDAPPPGARAPANERDVAALQLSALHELPEALVRLLGSRNDQEPRGVAIEPVDDSGPLLLPARGSACEPMDERPGHMPGSRVHDDACRLVDDEQVLVLVGDAELDVLRLDLPGGLRWQLYLELFAALQPVALRPLPPVDADRAALDEPLRRRARSDLRQLGQKAVEPPAGRLLGNSTAERREPAAAVCAPAAEGAE